MCPLINALEEHHFYNINESNPDGEDILQNDSQYCSEVSKSWKKKKKKQEKTEELKRNKKGK